MYSIPEDEYDDCIKHAMLHADLGQIYDMSKEKSKLHFYTDFQKILRKCMILCEVPACTYHWWVRVIVITITSIIFSIIDRMGIIVLGWIEWFCIMNLTMSIGCTLHYRVVNLRILFSSLFFVLFAGDKRRAERAQLNSADGNIAEKHDQFYRDHKLLLVLFRVLAVMPITRSSPGAASAIYLLFQN